MNARRIPKVGLVVLAGFALCATSHAVPKCSISIKEELKNGQVESTTFKSDLTSQAQCATLAHLHNKNFSPAKVATKSVTFVWNSASVAPKAVSVAQRKKSKKAKTATVAVHKKSRRAKSL